MIYDKTGYALLPMISFGPKWYYNLNKRKRKGKRIDGNSGNFLALETRFWPNLFVISNYKKVHSQNSLSFFPMWGIRRPIGNHFNYEIGVGWAFTHVFPYKKYNLTGDFSNSLSLKLRIGYRF